MKLLLTLDQHALENSPEPIPDRANYYKRYAARAVVVNERSAIALLHSRTGNYHKLPGGGIEPNEDEHTALAREISEELGCQAEVIAELGSVMEHRDFCNMTQISHGYLARVVGRIGKPNFTQDEINAGFEVVWTNDMDTAIELVQASTASSDPGQKFMGLRDTAILRAAAFLLK